MKNVKWKAIRVRATETVSKGDKRMYALLNHLANAIEHTTHLVRDGRAAPLA